VHDFFSHPDFNQHVIVRGTDRFHVVSEIAKRFDPRENVETFEFDPFDLSESFLLSNALETGQRMSVFSNLINKHIDVTIINVDIPEPVLLMDISLFQLLYPPNHSIDALLFKLSNKEANKIDLYLKKKQPKMELLSLKEDQLQQSNWVSSLTYNLKFLAFISVIVSTCLMIQFFRFLGKQREPQFEQLYKLGISQKKIKQLFVVEVGIIAAITTILALIVAKLIAQLSLGTFNQLITMFYFRLSATQIYYHWSIIVKTILASTIAFGVSYFSYFYGKKFGLFLPTVIKISVISIGVVMMGLLIIFSFPERLLVVVRL